MTKILESEIASLSPEQIISGIEEIKLKNPNNLMARHFNAEYFRNLEASLQKRLTSIIATGFKNPDSAMGAYAMSVDDYDLFSPVLEPMIRDYHKIPAEMDIDASHDWEVERNSCNLAKIDSALEKVSMRTRVARNISSFPLPGAMTQAQRIEFENLMIEAFKALIDTDGFGGNYFSLTPNSPYEIEADKYNQLVASHQMFKDMSHDKYLAVAGISAHWPYGRGIYISEKKDFLVWVGEEDHLRIISMQHGGNLNALFKRLHSGIEKIEELVPDFAESTRYGYVTSCPTNLGAGMRASLHMCLPKLTKNGQDITKAKQKAEKLGLSVRGAGGEHSDAGEGGLVDISPSCRLGITEVKIMQCLYEGVATLWKAEQES